MPTDLLDILRAVLGGLFKTGGITDAQHAELSAKLDAHDKSIQGEDEPAEDESEPEPSGPVVTRAPARPAGL